MYERIKELCRQNDMTVSELERLLGFSRGSLCKVDRNKPGYKRVKRIADYFQVPLEYLSDGYENPQRHYINDDTLALAQQLHDDKDLRMMFDTVKNLPPDAMQYVKDTLLYLEKIQKRQ